MVAPIVTVSLPAPMEALISRPVTTFDRSKSSLPVPPVSVISATSTPFTLVLSATAPAMMDKLPVKAEASKLPAAASALIERFAEPVKLTVALPKVMVPAVLAVPEEPMFRVSKPAPMVTVESPAAEATAPL